MSVAAASARERGLAHGGQGPEAGKLDGMDRTAGGQLRLGSPRGPRAGMKLALDQTGSAGEAGGGTTAVIALEEVYREHAGFVWRAVRRTGVPDDVAPDLVHDVFLVVHRRLPDYDGRAAMTTWLYGIARGVTANWRRAAGRRARRLAVVGADEPTGPISPEQGVQRREAKSLVEQFLERLEPKRREVFELVELEGMSGPEVAQALDLELGTVYSRLRRARAAFSKEVQRHRRHDGGRRSQ